MIKKLLLIAFMVLGFSSSALAQKITIQGTVLSADDETSLPGVAVTVPNTSIGTITDLDGTFKLKVPNSAKEIKLSYVGYLSKTIKINKKTKLGIIKLKTDAVGLDEVTVMASVVTDRKTPISYATISSEQIALKLGTQEFPEILKTTPSIYTSKEGGGYGDATVYVRGFDSNNVGVLINGIPVNDMESGKVYWSNWAGLSDVARTMQVQRGLGASKLGLSSVGGTINILTKGADAKKGGKVKFNIGADGYKKELFTLSTGLLDNGWSVTLLGSHTTGDGYVNGTNFEGWSYFANITKVINNAHTLSFMITGAPQWHNQRGNKHTIQQYRENKDKFKYNSDYGIRNGEIYGGNYGYNEYHKPQAQFNHYWKIKDNLKLNTSLYASIGTGGGRIIDGPQKDWLSIDRYTGLDNASIKRTAGGLLDFDAVEQANKNLSINGSQAIIGMSHNDHKWAGLLSNLTYDWNKIKFTTGLDFRYYRGSHYKEVEDLLGGKFFLDNKNINQEASTWLKPGDKYAYYNDGYSMYTGLFAQAEYSNDKISGFISGAIANKSYKRKDFFQKKPGNQTTEWVNFTPWNIKGGASYKLGNAHTIFANGGYVKRAPFSNNVFLNYSNDINKGVKYEEIITTELGYKYATHNFNASVTLYRTEWNNRSLSRSNGQDRINISGMNQIHQGIEGTAKYKFSKKFTLEGMFSIGDWKYADNVHAAIFDDNQTAIKEYNFLLDGVHVGNSAQTTASLSASYEILPKLRLNADYVYYANSYADFDATKRDQSSYNGDSWKLPNVGLFDLGFSYKFKIGKLDASLSGHVNNLFDTEYISKAQDGTTHSSSDALVYYGFGRTWSTGLSIRF